MSITVNTNMPSIIAQKSLYKSTNKMNTALQRLSTGLRINSAKDDAAGSAISTKLEYKISSYDVAKDNAQMGQSMLDTANGTLSQINSMLQRIRDLSEQAANGTYGKDERKAMQAEIDGLTEEIYRIKNTTEFNGKKIFGEEKQNFEKSVPTMSMSEVSEANWDLTENQVIGISSAQELKKMADLINSGKDSANRTFALTADIDLNELGDIDGKGSNWIAISLSGNFNGNGYTISNLKINKPSQDLQGLFSKMYGTVKNLNLLNCDIKGNNRIGGLAGTCYSSVENCSVSGNIKGINGHIGGLCGEFYNNCYMTDCSFIGTVNGGYVIGGLIGNISSKGIIKNCYTSADVIGNTKVGKVIGRIRIESDTEISNCYYDESKSTSLDAIGLNDTGKDFSDIKATNKNPFKKEISIKTNLQVGINSNSNSTITVDTGFSLGDLNISVLSDFSARNSLDKIDALINKVSNKMTDIGSTQSRLESVINFQEVQHNALTSANSLIKDADIALESANYIKNQILQNVTSSLLATANQNPQIALQLL